MSRWDARTASAVIEACLTCRRPPTPVSSGAYCYQMSGVNIECQNGLSCMVELILGVAWCVLMYQVGSLQTKVHDLVQDVCSDDEDTDQNEAASK